MTIRIIQKPNYIENKKKLKDNQLWVWYSEISKEICNKIIMSANDTWDTGKFGNRNGRGIIDSSIRSTDVHFASEEWIYDLTEPYLIEANKNAGWNYDISGIEPYQIGKYSADISGHYGWHQDSLGSWNSINNTSNKNLNGKTRKISMSLVLSDPDEYEGGQLEIWGKSIDVYKKGSIIFFPSWMPHRVTPVTKGTRYSLVMWFIGAPFK